MEQVDLSGFWQLRWSDGQRGQTRFAERKTVDEDRYLDATVPGEVHLDLWRHGWIPNPYTGANVLASRWIEDCIWSYRRTFTAPAAARKRGHRAWLVFEGLDLSATIVLNGTTLATHDNAFCPCRVEVTGKLLPGENVLTVHTDCGLHAVSDKPGAGYANSPDHTYLKRFWMRKPQCQFGWDWAPRLLNVGIHKPVRLEWTSAPARLDQLVPLVEVNETLDRGSVRVRVFAEGLRDQPVNGRLIARIEGTPASADIPVVFKPGIHAVEVTLEVPDPDLWWPTGHGKQPLYTLHVELRTGRTRIATASARIGFRHVRVNQAPHPEGGNWFTLEVNGRKIFCKGGNFVPADMITARIDRARYDRLTDLALESNFNMLRVWGGGLYESDDFYELCDRKGILVWQEFIFACSRCPATDEDFVRNVTTEARHHVRRLASHPSLVIWCGNNEIEWGYWDWGFDRKSQVLPDHGLYHLVLRRIVNEEDPTRYYQPSSPYSPDGTHPNSDLTGDQHPWSVGFGNTDFRDYRKMNCRFPNEGGILGPTSLPTLRECLEGSDGRMTSLAWHVHENSVAFWDEPPFPDRMIQQWLGRDVRSFSLEEYAYWAGLVQGEGLREYIDNFRRRMFSTSAAIFWMYNDCWPTTRSWTTVDYNLRRTPAFHPVRRAFAPVNVVLTEEGDSIVVYGINDTPSPVRASLRFGVMELAGGYPVDRSADVLLPANASTPLAQFGKSLWRDPKRAAAFAVLSRDGKVLARNRLFLPLFKDIAWPRVKIAVSVEKRGTATFRSEAFAWGVCIDLAGGRIPADNFFDLYPGQPWTIPWTRKSLPNVLFHGNAVKTQHTARRSRARRA